MKLFRFLLQVGGSSSKIPKPIKRSTGLPGVPVAKNPHHVLRILYGKILRVLNQMPMESAYRKYTEEIVAQRALIVSNVKDIKKLEDEIDCGQVEELIIQAENELALARLLLKHEPWKPLTTHPPTDQWCWPPAH